MTDELYEDVKIIHEKLHGGSAYTKVPTFYFYLKMRDNYLIMVRKLKDVQDFLIFLEANASDTHLLFVPMDELIRLLACYIREDKHGEYGN